MNLREAIGKRPQEFTHLCKSYEVKSLYVFGSSINDKFNEDSSDIDLLIDFEPEKENFDNFMAVYDLFEHIFKNEKIEVVIQINGKKKCTIETVKDIDEEKIINQIKKS